MVVDRELLPLGTAVSGGRGLLRGMEFRVPGNRTAISHPSLGCRVSAARIYDTALIPHYKDYFMCLKLSLMQVMRAQLLQGVASRDAQGVENHNFIIR